MISFFLLLFCSFFCILGPLKSKVHFTFNIIKLLTLLHSHQRKSPFFQILFVTITFFFLKFLVVGVSSKGLDFFMTYDFWHRIISFGIIYALQMIHYLHHRCNRLVKTALESKFLKMIIASGLNSFDVATVNNLVFIYLSGSHPEHLTFALAMLIFSSAALVNRFITVYDPCQWRNIKILMSEFKSIMITYSIISITNICFHEEQPRLTQAINWVAIFCLSGYNYHRSEKNLDNTIFDMDDGNMKSMVPSMTRSNSGENSMSEIDSDEKKASEPQ